MLLLGLCSLLAGCITNPALDEARRQIANGDTEGGLSTLQRAMKDAPNDQELRATYQREKDRLVSRRIMAADGARLAERWDEAGAGYDQVLKLDPSNTRAISGKGRIALDKRNSVQVLEVRNMIQRGETAEAEANLRAILSSNPQHVEARNLLRQIQERAVSDSTLPPTLKSAMSQDITLEFKDASLKSVFEVIARTANINFVFDRDVKGDTPVTLFVRKTRIEEVMKLLLVTNQLERKVLNENTVLVYPNTPAKQKDYQELVVKSFYLRSADVKQAMALVKTMTKTRDVFADEKLNLLVVRDTPDVMRMVERLIEGLDLAEPEVMLEVEVLEVSRNKLLNAGIQWPDQIGYGLLQPLSASSVSNTATGTTTTTTTTAASGGTLQQGYIDLRNRVGLTTFITNPGFYLNLHDGIDNADILANPRIRVKNREKAKVHIGERLPVFTTTSTANVGVSASVNYLDVGLKLDVEPTVSLDDDVSIKVGLEVSSVVKEVTGPQSSLAYQVGTRTAATVLRLRDGETQVLAGLINDEERSSTLQVPGLGDIPGIGRLFGNKKNSRNKTEIVLLITPRIVRNVQPPGPASIHFPSGTDASAGSPPLRLAMGQGGSMAIAPMSAAAPGANAVTSMPAPAGAPVPFVPPEAGSPQPVAPQGQAQLDLPAQTQAGKELALAVSVAGVSGGQGGQVEVAFDPTAVEVAGAAADGRLMVALNPGAGGMQGLARVRVLPGAGSEIAFQVVSIVVETPGGRVAVAAPPPRLVKVVR